MSKPFGFEKPLGMRDILPSLHDVKAHLREQVQKKIQSWGYRMLETPALEYDETVGEATAIGEQQLFKVLDQQGKTLVLRPDMTAPIARVAASTYKAEAYPLRLAYDTHVFRAQRDEGGHPAEFEQIGVELIGDGTVSADAETIALMAELFEQEDVPACQVAIGHVGYVDALLAEVTGDAGHTSELRQCLYEKNLAGFRQCVRDLPLTDADQARLLALLSLRGGREVLSHAERLVHTAQAKQTLTNLNDLVDILEDYGCAKLVSFDMTLVSHMNYYTGIVYEGYSGSLGFPLASGGRYDELLGRFQHPAPATGFGIFFDRLVESVDGQHDGARGCCIIYTPLHRQEALALAREKRGAGQRVVLQERAGITDTTAFSTCFTEVVYRTGEAEEDET